MNEIKPVMSMFANELDCLRARDQWLHARISTLERELAESRAREARLRVNDARYRLLRRGQKWSVINGIGDDLRAERLDAEVDAALQQKGDTNADA